MTNCIHQLDPELCVLCEQQREIHMAYQCLNTTGKETTNLPDIQDKNEVLRWYRRSI